VIEMAAGITSVGSTPIRKSAEIIGAVIMAEDITKRQRVERMKSELVSEGVKKSPIRDKAPKQHP